MDKIWLKIVLNRLKCCENAKKILGNHIWLEEVPKKINIDT